MKKTTLNNGLRVFLIPLEGTAAVTTLVMTKVGSRYEPEGLNGASHFIEHMMFKGSTSMPTPADVARGLDAIGAQYNAYTSKEYTGYYIKCDARHQEFATQTLYDMTFDSLYKQEEMDRERRVIIEEINMYQDTPTRHIDELLEKVMFEGNSLGWQIAGTPETMRTMTREDVMSFRDRYYIPSRMAIAVAGKINEQTMEWLERTFGTISGNEHETNGFSAFDAFNEHELTPIAMQQKATEQVHVALGFPGVGYQSEDRYAMRVLETLFGGNMSSRLFMKVREEGGLAYRIFANHSHYEDVGVFAVVAGLDKARLSEAMDRVFAEIDDLVENGPTDEEMQRTRQYLRGMITLSLENSMNWADWFGRYALFESETESPEQYLERIDAITKEDVQRLATRVFDRAKMTMSYIGPETDPEVIRSTLS